MPVKIINKKVLVSRKQLEFIHAKESEVLFSGGYRSAKTVALMWCALRAASVPGNQVLICRKHTSDLWASTLHTLMEGEGNMPPLLSRNAYTDWNKVQQRINLNGGGTIWYKGFDDSFSLRGRGLGCICVDEGSQLEKAEYMELLGRLSNSSAPKLQVFIATNPATQNHFLYKRFFINKDPSRRVITVSSFDNPWSPKDYLESVKRNYEGDAFRRFVLGEWCALGSAVFPEFGDKNIIHRGESEFREFLIGIDDGWWGFTCLVCGVDGNRNIHVLVDHKVNKLVEDEKCALVNKYAHLRPTCIVDSAAPSLIEKLSRSGLDTRKAQKEIESGLENMRNRMAKGSFTMEPTCQKLRQEIDNYVREEDTGKIKERQEDHEIDSARYVCRHLDHLDNSGYIYPSIYFSKEEDEEEKKFEDEEEVIKITDNIFDESNMGSF
jgi:PBSX family phage terminase large subunit